MKIKILNFGPINELCFDVSKDLNLIYGENAIGKSYATYCLYSIIKNVKNKSVQRFRFDANLKQDIDDIIKKFKSLKPNTEININEDIINFIEKYLKIIYVDNVQNSLLNTFSSLENLKNKYTKKDFEISLMPSENIEVKFYFNKGNLDLKFKQEEFLSEKYSLILKNTKSTRFTLNRSGKKLFGNSNEEEFFFSMTKFLIGNVNKVLDDIDYNIRDVYYLPASRSGLYQALNAFTPIVAELTQNRFFIQNKSIELPSLAEPLSDYFIDISTLDKKHYNKDFSSIIQSLEKDILKGNVTFDDKTKKISYKQIGINLELNLSETSSMVSELSPLVLYFKHIINHKYNSQNNDFYYYDDYYMSRNRYRRARGYDIIFIEEPEAHLHPEVQIKLIELFASLSKFGLKIFITSHSNYMFNKLNNIILSKSIDSNKIEVYHLRKDKNGGTINGSMEVSEDGIIDNNFQDVTEKLYNERLNILENND